MSTVTHTPFVHTQATEPTVSEARSSWVAVPPEAEGQTPNDGNTWTTTHQQQCDLAFLLGLEQNASFRFDVQQRSIRVPEPGEEADAAAAAAAEAASKDKKGKKGKKDAAKDVPVDDGEPGLPKPPAALYELPFNESRPAASLNLSLASFFIDGAPVAVELGHNPLTGRPLARKSPQYASKLPPPSLEYLAVEISIDKPLLSPQQVQAMLPAELSVAGVHDLPDEPFAYADMGKYYHPVRYMHTLSLSRSPLTTLSHAHVHFYAVVGSSFSTRNEQG